MKVLKYTEYRKFTPVIEKAKIACQHSKQTIYDHFAHVAGMINVGKGAERKINDYKLSRYACYLIANLFRIDQTNQKLITDNINTEQDANMTHYNMGKDIRKFIKKQGGTMPENLPTPNKSIKEIEKTKSKLNS